MSVRVFSREDMYKELKKVGFEPTDEKTEKFTVWKNAENDVISVNHSHETYPYYYLADLLKVSGIDYNSSGTVIDMRKYKVNQRDD